MPSWNDDQPERKCRNDPIGDVDWDKVARQPQDASETDDIRDLAGARAQYPREDEDCPNS
jgi:hypothetical protein